MANEEKCITCEAFKANYMQAILVYGKGYGLCANSKLKDGVTACHGLLEFAVHEDFGCIHHYAVPSLETAKVNPSDCPRCGFLDSKHLKGK